MCELRSCAKRLGGLEVNHDFALIGLAFIYPALPTCLVVYIQKSRLPLDTLFLCSDCCKWCNMSSPGGLLLFSTIPLVLTTVVVKINPNML